MSTIAERIEQLQNELKLRGYSGATLNNYTIAVRLCFLNERNGLHTDIVVTARQNKGSAEQKTDNSDYTAALITELRAYHSEYTEPLPSEAYFLNVSARLNSAVKAQQNCA